MPSGLDTDHLIHETEKLINKLKTFVKKLEKQDLAHMDELAICINLDLRGVFELANYILQYLHSIKIDNLILRFAVKVVLKYSDNKCATLMGDLLHQKHILGELSELAGLAGVEEDYPINS